jgi:hypothetical protein
MSEILRMRSVEPVLFRGEVDFGSDALRRRAERQAAILRLAS